MRDAVGVADVGDRAGRRRGRGRRCRPTRRRRSGRRAAARRTSPRCADAAGTRTSAAVSRSDQTAWQSDSKGVRGDAAAPPWSMGPRPVKPARPAKVLAHPTRSAGSPRRRPPRGRRRLARATGRVPPQLLPHRRRDPLDRVGSRRQQLARRGQPEPRAAQQHVPHRARLLAPGGVHGLGQQVGAAGHDPLAELRAPAARRARRAPRSLAAGELLALLDARRQIVARDGHASGTWASGRAPRSRRARRSGRRPSWPSAATWSACRR